MCKQHALQIAWTIAQSIAFLDFRVLRWKFTYDWKCVNTTYHVPLFCPLPASRKDLRLTLRSALFGEGGRDWRPWACDQLKMQLNMSADVVCCNISSKLFSCSTQLSMKFWLLLKSKMLNNKDFSCLQILKCCIYHTYKCWHFNIYEHYKFHAQLRWAWKKFYNVGPGLRMVL